MRKLSLGLVLLVLPGLALADYRPVLIGYLIHNTLTSSGSGSSNASLGSSTGLGIGFALDGGGNERLSLDYTDFDLRNGNSLQLLDFNVDQFFQPQGLPAPLSLFAGASLGGGKLDLSGANGSSVTRANAGLRAGAAWRLDEHWGLELGARYLYTGLTAKINEGGGQTGELRVKANTSTWLGLSYRFD